MDKNLKKKLDLLNEKLLSDKSRRKSDNVAIANNIKNNSLEQRKKVSEGNKKHYATGKRQLPEGLTFEGRNHDNSNKQAMSHKGKKNGMYGVRLTGEQNHMFGKQHKDHVKQRLQEVSLMRSQDQHCVHCYGYFTQQAYSQHHGDYCKQNPNKIIKQRKQKVLSGPQTQLTCPHCNKTGGEGNMKRYHMDNCKLKK